MLCCLLGLLVLFASCGVINVGTEQLLTLSQLAKRLPRHRNDRPVHPSTCHRRRSPGVRGVRLECLRIGGIWHTSWQAFQRFCEQLTAIEDGTSSSVASIPSAQSVGGDGHQDRVEQELRKRGV
jgi:hypothetical protein